MLTAISTHHGVDGRTVICLAGEHDCTNVDELRDAIDRIAPGVLVELNLEEVEFMDSSVIHQVMRLHTKCTDERGRLLVVAPERSNAYRVLELAGLLEMLAPGSGLARRTNARTRNRFATHLWSSIRKTAGVGERG
jgi:anti-anti-sigma factor